MRIEDNIRGVLLRGCSFVDKMEGIIIYWAVIALVVASILLSLLGIGGQIPSLAKEVIILVAVIRVVAMMLRRVLRG